MYDDSYLVPANAKRGTLIFNIFRPVDLAIFIIGVVTTMLLLIILSGDSLLMTILAIVPAGVSALLVTPIPHYHNVLCAIQSIISFYGERRRYVWKGWCYYEKFGSDSKDK